MRTDTLFGLLIRPRRGDGSGVWRRPSHFRFTLIAKFSEAPQTLDPYRTLTWATKRNLAASMPGAAQ